MNRNIFFLIALCLLYIGCREKENTSPVTPSVSNHYRDSSLNFIGKKFELSYPENFTLDSNSLIFYRTATFDTSFLIHLKRGRNGINGVYYELLPSYHNNVNDFATEENQLLFFEGYSFTLDSTKWLIIKRMAEKMLSSDTSFKSNEGIRDGKEYVLSYNFKSSKSHIDNNSEYESFYEFLKGSFLENFIQRRKPIMHKAK